MPVPEVVPTTAAQYLAATGMSTEAATDVLLREYNLVSESIKQNNQIIDRLVAQRTVIDEQIQQIQALNAQIAANAKTNTAILKELVVK